MPLPHNRSSRRMPGSTACRVRRSTRGPRRSPGWPA